MLNRLVKISTLIATLLVSSQAYSKPPIFVDKPEDAFALSEDLEADLLLVYTATWCGSCITMKNDLHSNLDVIENTIVCYVDYDRNQEMAKEYDVKILPTYFLYKGKKERKRTVGYKNLVKFKDWLRHE